MKKKTRNFTSVDLTAELVGLIATEAERDFPGEIANIERELRILIGEALAFRASGKKPEILSELRPSKKPERTIANMPRPLALDVAKTAKADWPHEKPKISPQTRLLVREALTLRKLKRS